MKPTILLIDLAHGELKRYVDGEAVERYDITDRRQFDRDFSPTMAEALRQGTYRKTRPQ